MNLLVVSHKLCWPCADSPTGYSTDGGFPFQMEAISELFDNTVLLVPSKSTNSEGLSPLKGNQMKVVSLTELGGKGLRRKFAFPIWLLKNGLLIWREVRKADAVHAPIPGDVGTIGMAFALLMRKPLFVRHCGNWLVQRTLAEHIWKRSMEFFGGGRNVMFATGGGADEPSSKAPNVKWIFSTSLRRGDLKGVEPKNLPTNGEIKLVIACRQEEKKGTQTVIESMPAILQAFPDATLSVVGDGSLLPKLKQRAVDLGMESRVVFHGKLEHSKVLKIFRDSHLFCYPTEASEGFPKVVIEALSFGIPVITTKVSVLPHLIENGCGVLLESRSPDALAKAVISSCEDRVMYSEMSKAALQVSSQYCLEDWRDFIGATLRNAWGVASLSAEDSPVG